MGIADIIERKKREFFIAKDADKLELQKAQLARERAEIERMNKLRADVRQEQSKLREARSMPTRERLTGIRSGFQNFASNVQRFSTENESPGLSRVGSLSDDNPNIVRESVNASPFSNGGSPFATRATIEKVPSAKKVSKKR